MTDDDDFEPRLGTIRSRSGKRGQRYLQQVLKAAALGGGLQRGGSSSRRGAFQGSHIGRGAGVGRMLSSRDRYAAFRARRVVVKTRIVKLKGHGLKGSRVHLRYLQRDGVTREGLPGNLYDAKQDRTDGPAFLERSDSDRHQFRFIVSAEDAIEYDDLKEFTRRLMRQMEEDLSTRLDWVAVDHHNTGHPHTHVVLRGRDERNRDLVIAREYLSQGMRERAAEIVSLDLGPRTDLEVERRLRHEVEQERFTSLDRGLLREAGTSGFIRSGSAVGDAFHQTLRAGRLQKLRRLGLAEEIEAGRWRLADDLESTLRRMGEHGDIIKTLHREMGSAGITRPSSGYAIYDPMASDVPRLVGRIVARGLSDEINDRHYLIVDGLDGRVHYIDIGRPDAAEPIPEGAIVAILPKRIEPKAADRVVAEIAIANDRRYSIDIHLRHDPTATAAFAEAHLRRLEAMRRLGAGIERQPDGTWIITPDHLERATEFERKQARAAPVRVEMLSSLTLNRQVGADGATWLDRELISDTPTPVGANGFGREVRAALTQRQQWLVEQELARPEHDRIIYRANMLSLLRQRELNRIGAQLSKELGLHYAEVRPGERIEGIYRQPIDLASGRFAVIEKSREFTLVPWRAVLDRSLGQPVAGLMRGDLISWTLARQRGVKIGR